MYSGERHRVKSYVSEERREIDSVGDQLDESLETLNQTVVDQVGCSEQVEKWIGEHNDLYVYTDQYMQ